MRIYYDRQGKQDKIPRIFFFDRYPVESTMIHPTGNLGAQKTDSSWWSTYLTGFLLMCWCWWMTEAQLPGHRSGWLCWLVFSFYKFLISRAHKCPKDFRWNLFLSKEWEETMTFFNNLKSTVSLSPWLLLLFIDSHLDCLRAAKSCANLFLFAPKLGCQRVSVHHGYRLQRP